MIYVAFLRGINVGGNHKVDMKQLKAACEAVGMRSVRTYINSGNVIFTYDEISAQKLVALLEATIEKSCGFAVGVLVRTLDEIRTTVATIEREWNNDKEMKCDVLFLWSGVVASDLVDALGPRDGIDEVRTSPGVIVWKVDRVNASRSGLLRIMGMPAYKEVTVRNCNTVRKALSIMEDSVA